MVDSRLATRLSVMPSAVPCKRSKHMTRARYVSSDNGYSHQRLTQILTRRVGRSGQPHDLQMIGVRAQSDPPHLLTTRQGGPAPALGCQAAWSCLTEGPSSSLRACTANTGLSACKETRGAAEEQRGSTTCTPAEPQKACRSSCGSGSKGSLACASLAAPACQLPPSHDLSCHIYMLKPSETHTASAFE